MAPKGKHVCGPHQKVPCKECDGKRALKLCCAEHHRDDDNLARRFCPEHRMTKCNAATCSTPEKCCSYGHHVCVKHSKTACEGCMKMQDIKNRRPYRCCIRGHHEGEPINYRIARGSDLRRKRKIKTKQESSSEEENPHKRKKRSQKQSTLQGEKRKRACVVVDDEDDDGSDVIAPAVKPAKHGSVRNKR